MIHGMQMTTNFGLIKPEPTDFYNVEDYNNNMDIIDEELQKVFQRGNDLKERLVSQIIAFGTEADTSETFEALFEKLASVSTGSGDALPEHVLTPHTFTNSEGEQTGTMPNMAGTTVDASAVTKDDAYVYATPQEGFYDETSMIRIAKEDVGGSGVTLLGTGTSFDLSSVVGYESLTVDNFLVVCDEDANATKSQWINHTATFNSYYNYNTYYTAPVKNYDATTGMLTITQATCYASENAIGHAFPKTYPPMKVYLIVGEIKTL